MTQLVAAHPARILSALSLTLVVLAAEGADVLTRLRPAEPQPTALSPGLAVEYTYGMVNQRPFLPTGTGSAG